MSKPLSRSPVNEICTAPSKLYQIKLPSFSWVLYEKSASTFKSIKFAVSVICPHYLPHLAYWTFVPEPISRYRTSISGTRRLLPGLITYSQTIFFYVIYRTHPGLFISQSSTFYGSGHPIFEICCGMSM